MKIICFGDSHGHYFRNVYPHFADVEPITIDAATIIGLGRVESTLNARDTIFNQISSLGREDYIALKFGQVDIEFGFYYRNAFKGEAISFDSFVQLLVESYINFIQNIKELHPNIVVCGINLPTIFNHEHAVEHTSKTIIEYIEDKSLVQTFLNKLNSIFPSVKDRTLMSIDFNAALKKACASIQTPYFDLTEEALNPSWGLLSSKFRPFVVDHHYPLTYEIVEIFTLKLIMTVKGLNYGNSYFYN